MSTTTCGVMLGLSLFIVAPAAGQPATHPLDPLTASEIKEAVALVRADPRCVEDSHFPEVALQEPAKASVLAFDMNGGPRPPRAAHVVVYDARRPMTSNVVADLTAGRVVSWRDRPGAQPFIMAHEYEAAARLLKADARFVAALARRGIRDAADVFIDVWAPGPIDAYHTDKRRPEPRIVRGLSFLQAGGRNPYARPIEGLVGVINLTEGKVIDVRDDGPVTIPSDPSEFDNHSPAPSTAPASTAITVDGHAIRWKQWRLRYAITPREGLVLYRVHFVDGQRTRDILYRASLSELVVPYGEPSPTWIWRSAFDAGEYGLGKSAGPMKVGHDVPANATVLSAAFADDAGRPFVVDRAVAAYEVDGGVAWRHYDFVSQTTTSRRARELWITFWTAIGNYDYGFHWIFREDGSIESRVQLTGILLGKGASLSACSACASRPLSAASQPAGAAEDRYARLIAPHLSAPNHQHFLNYRLDLDVDGPLNTLIEQNVLAEPEGTRNPGHNAFFASPSVLSTEKAARRQTDARTHRTWKVVSHTAPGAAGHRPGYGLHLPDGAPAFAAPQAHFRAAGAFVEHALWATRMDDTQRYAGGEYPNMAEPTDGLAAWTADDASIVNEDLVVWCTIGLTHVARPEEWPIMPAASTGWRLMPDGFFVRNPGLN